MTEAIGLVNDGKLKSYFDWIDWVGNLEKSHDSSPDALKTALINAVSKRVPNNPFGVFFSGGVDSATIATILKHCNTEFTCYTVGFQDHNIETPLDILAARSAAKLLQLQYKEKIFNLKEAERIIQKTVDILPPPKKIDADFVVKVGVGAVIVAAASIADRTTFFSGLGSEEIFAGYERHSNAKDINEECWRGLKLMWKRDFTRDFAIAQALHLKVLTPFLDEKVIVAAMSIEGSKKINKDHKKLVLRKIAETLGVPNPWRKKQGAQYGSKFDKAIEKLAKLHKCKSKGEYLESLL